MPSEEYALSDETLESVQGGTGTIPTVSVSCSPSAAEIDKLLRQREQLLRQIQQNPVDDQELMNRIMEETQQFREDLSGALGRVDEQAKRLKESVDALLEIQAQIVRNI